MWVHAVSRVRSRTGRWTERILTPAQREIVGRRERENRQGRRGGEGGKARWLRCWTFVRASARKHAGVAAAAAAAAAL